MISVRLHDAEISETNQHWRQRPAVCSLRAPEAERDAETPTKSLSSEKYSQQQIHFLPRRAAGSIDTRHGGVELERAKQDKATQQVALARVVNR